MEEHGGVVLSATIDKYAYGSLVLGEGSDMTVTSLDYDVVARYGADEPISADGDLALVKAVLRKLIPDRAQGLRFLTHSDAPPGSGLGSSSAMVVALVGLLRHWRKLPLTNYQIAELAFAIEREDLGIKGGRQDQYAAVFGGFNYIEFSSSAVIVNPLRIAVDTVNELEYNLVLCYTGATRLSANIIDTQVRGYRQHEPAVLESMSQMKRITVELKNALLQRRLTDFGHLLHEAWIYKKQLAASITTPAIDALYDAARRQGALGGKLLGAGGGGFLLLYCDAERKHLISRELESLGGQVVPFAFEGNGLQSWDIE
jgi:D-glycero-alpha-D-manno-heptose-7-phosphate kinase